MKDVTSTTFGLIIGFLLPGVAGLWALGPWFPPVATAFAKVQDAKTDIGLSLLGLMAALGTGLIVTLFRWLLFEQLFFRIHCLDTNDFEKLGESGDKLLAFRAAVDEHYRYHQFWGASQLLYLSPTSVGCSRSYRPAFDPSVFGPSSRR